MLENNRYVALGIVLALVIFYAIIKRDYLDYELQCTDKTSNMFAVKKVVLFSFTILLVFVLTAQISSA
jgi:hypothetical protein